MLNKIKTSLIRYLIEHNSASINELTNYLNIKSRMVYLYINELNYLLKKNNFNEIVVKKGYVSLNLSIEQLNFLILNNYYSFSQDERIDFICFDIIVFGNKRTLEDYANLFIISKNSISSDFKKLKDKLKKLNLNLTYSTDLRYQILGDELAIRSFLINYVSSYLLTNDEIIMSKLFDVSILKNQYIANKLDDLNSLNRKNTKSYLDLIQCYLSILFIYYKKKKFLTIDEKDKSILSSLKEFKFSTDLLNEYCKNNKIENNYLDENYYLTILLTSGNIIISDNKLKYHKKILLGLKNLKDVLYKMLSEIEKNHYIFFFEKDKLVTDLINHLIPAYYRAKFNLNVNVEYLNIVKEKYKKFFNITVKHIGVVENYLKIKFSQEEIALLSLYFVSNILYSSKMMKKIKTIIVTNQGFNIYRVLKLELENIFTNLDIVKIVNIDQFLELDEKFDLILSSTFLKNVEYVKINNILSEKNKKEINNKINTILSEKIKKEIPLSLVLKRDFINIFDEKNLSWEKAIKLCTDSLIKSKRINVNYIKAIINNINKYNSVITLSNKIAMPHASYLDGVNKLSFTFNIFKHPVVFPGKSKFNISLIIILAPEDNEKHIKPLFELVDILKQEENVNRLLKMKDTNEIYQFILEGE
ncbi:PRD domain-containing protein [Malacoplasma penetrans]|uniref:Transcriptional antiterminator BglG family n=1 Tax=Malacoplasma penetrans (strain HF-2) TaxID=272633 RepID=Q8EVW2_MALP2|nr:PTS sugar transporter subunit IIA [Malacoplasma penetrans]RXY97239.1 PRD domain-containing protein [Malacoplasma penetrans]BAC44237.1 transcriptional antiterminator BglG family [Malacoplasma penetrans HF-2]